MSDVHGDDDDAELWVDGKYDERGYRLREINAERLVTVLGEAFGTLRLMLPCSNYSYYRNVDSSTPRGMPDLAVRNVCRSKCTCHATSYP